MCVPVVRVLMRTATEWKLMQVLKPHNKCVTAVAYSPEAHQMQTASLVPPVPVRYLPRPQSVHASCPLASVVTPSARKRTGVYSPGLHAWQSLTVVDALLAFALPALHSSQAMASEPSW